MRAATPYLTINYSHQIFIVIREVETEVVFLYRL
jgi:hypothetical protein